MPHEYVKKTGHAPVFACRRKKLQNIVNLAYRLAVFAAGPDRFLKACAFVSVFRHLFGNGLDLRGCQIAVGFCLRGQQFFLFFVERRLVDFLDRFLVVVVDVFKLVFRPVASMVFGAGVGRADENDGGNESGGRQSVKPSLFMIEILRLRVKKNCSIFHIIGKRRQSRPGQKITCLIRKFVVA